jgi:hypothetical protein
MLGEAESLTSTKSMLATLSQTASASRSDAISFCDQNRESSPPMKPWVVDQLSVTVPPSLSFQAPPRTRLSIHGSAPSVGVPSIRVVEAVTGTGMSYVQETDGKAMG